MSKEKPVFIGFHLEREEGGGISRPCIMAYDAVGIPIFHSRREAWKFLRGWSKGLTTVQLKRKGYRCLPVEVMREEGK